MNGRRLTIHEDEESFEERSNRILNDVRRRLDQEPKEYDLGRRGLSSSTYSSKPYSSSSFSSNPSYSSYSSNPSYSSHSSNPSSSSFSSNPSSNSYSSKPSTSSSSLFSSSSLGGRDRWDSNGLRDEIDDLFSRREVDPDDDDFFRLRPRLGLGLGLSRRLGSTSPLDDGFFRLIPSLIDSKKFGKTSLKTEDLFELFPSWREKSGGKKFGDITSPFDDDDFFETRKTTSTRRRATDSPKSPTSDDLTGKESFSDRTKKSFDGSTDSASDGEKVNGSGDPQRFSMNFDVKGYRASDITVTVEDDTLVVQAKRLVEDDGEESTKEYCRRVRIPPDLDPVKLSSTLTTDGILTVEAPWPPQYGSPSCESSTENFFPDAASPKPEQEQSIPLDTPVFSEPDAEGGRRIMKLCLTVGKPYTPGDILVKLEGRKLIVEATHEEKQESKASRTSMQRDFDLTEDIDLSTVQALLKPSGLLTITALV